MKKFLIIILFLLLGLFWLKILYIVPYSNYTITDQTGKVKLKDYPELKEISFMYSTDLYIEYTEPINLELEKINFRFNDEVIGTAEINKNLNEFEKDKILKTRKIYVITFFMFLLILYILIFVKLHQTTNAIIHYFSFKINFFIFFILVYKKREFLSF